jgi:hypothetical protein
MIITPISCKSLKSFTSSLHKRLNGLCFNTKENIIIIIIIIIIIVIIIIIPNIVLLVLGVELVLVLLTVTSEIAALREA